MYEKICLRCKNKIKLKNFNCAFGVCNDCVTSKDYDKVQSYLSKAMRGLTPLEKQEILTEFYFDKTLKRKKSHHG